MSGPKPKSADLIAADPTTPLPWHTVRDALRDTRMYWLATVHPTGRPHVRPVLAVWLDGALYITSNAAARKGRNLAADPRCTVTARTDTMDVVLEGHATPVTSVQELNQVAEAYRVKYSWPVTVTDGAFDAPYGAPTAPAALPSAPDHARHRLRLRHRRLLRWPRHSLPLLTRHRALTRHAGVGDQAVRRVLG